MLPEIGDVRAEVARFDRQQSAVRHRLARVHGKVEQDLMQLAGVRIDRPEILLALDARDVSSRSHDTNALPSTAPGDPSGTTDAASPSLTLPMSVTGTVVVTS